MTERQPPWNRGRLRANLALTGAWLAFFSPLLFTSSVPYHRDLLLLFIPIRQYLHERLMGGELPQWIPYIGMGEPFVGQIVTATFHPQTLLFLPFSGALAVKYNVLLAFLVALAGAYRVTRELGVSRPAAVIGAYAFAFGGYMFGVADNLPYLLSTATFPWVFWAAWRVATRRRLKDAALLGLLTTSLFLGGDAQAFAYAPLLYATALIGAGASRRATTLFALAGVIAVLGCCIELLPALHLARDSARRLMAGDEALFGGWSLHPLRIFDLFTPSFVPDEFSRTLGIELFGGRPHLWSSTLFVGALGCTLVVLGLTIRSPARRPMLALLLIAIWLALGPRFLLLKLLWKAVPLLGSFRYPEKFLAIAWVPFAFFVAVGADAALQNPRRAVRFFGGATVLLALLAMVVRFADGAGLLWHLGRASKAIDDTMRSGLNDTWSRGLITSAAFAAVTAALLWFSIRSPRYSAALGAVLVVELWTGNFHAMPSAPREAVEDSNAFTRRILESAKDGAPPARGSLYEPMMVETDKLEGGDDLAVRLLRLELFSGTGTLDHVSAFSPALPGMSERYVRLFGERPDRDPPLAPRFNGCFVVKPQHRPTQAPEREVAVEDGFSVKLLERPCLPRANLVATQPVADLFEALKAMQSDPSTVVWEGGPATAATQGEISWQQYEPEHLVLRVKAAQATALVVRDLFARGWTATIDGAPTPIYATNVAARGIALPAGEHDVEMRYRSPGLALGALLTGLGVILALALWLTSRRTVAQ